MKKEEEFMSNRQYGLSILFLLFSFTSVQASTVTVVSGGELIGFDNITVGTETYNVRFVEGSFISVFGDSTGLDFTTSSDAAAAATALLNAYDLFPTYDDDTSLTYGLTGTSGQIFTPYRLGNNVASRNYFNIDTNLVTQANYDHVTGNVGMIPTYDTTSGNFSGGRVWADWDMVSPVPVPAAVWLFGSGLIGLAGIARRNKA